MDGAEHNLGLEDFRWPPEEHLRAQRDDHQEQSSVGVGSLAVVRLYEDLRQARS